MVEMKLLNKNDTKDILGYTYYDEFKNKVQKTVETKEEYKEYKEYFNYLFKLIKEEHIPYGEACRNAYLKFKKTYYKRRSFNFLTDFQEAKEQ